MKNTDIMYVMFRNCLASRVLRQNYYRYYYEITLCKDKRQFVRNTNVLMLQWKLNH